jgi:hypothetical protein
MFEGKCPSLPVSPPPSSPLFDLRGRPCPPWPADPPRPRPCARTCRRSFRGRRPHTLRGLRHPDAGADLPRPGRDPSRSSSRRPASPRTPSTPVSPWCNSGGAAAAARRLEGRWTPPPDRDLHLRAGDPRAASRSRSIRGQDRHAGRGLRSRLRHRPAASARSSRSSRTRCAPVHPVAQSPPTARRSIRGDYRVARWRRNMPRRSARSLQRRSRVRFAVPRCPLTSCPGGDLIGPPRGSGRNRHFLGSPRSAVRARPCPPSSCASTTTTSVHRIRCQPTTSRPSAAASSFAGELGRDHLQCRASPSLHLDEGTRI